MSGFEAVISYCGTTLFQLSHNHYLCGAVGRVVGAHTRDAQFESSHHTLVVAQLVECPLRTPETPSSNPTSQAHYGELVEWPLRTPRPVRILLSSKHFAN